MDIHKQATSNFVKHIRKNSYPGRGLVIGRSESGGWVIVYWIMGRSPNSRNRHFVAEGEILRTEPIDASRVANPDLVIYKAMDTLPGIYLVTNGDQTRTLKDTLTAGGTFDEALLSREREPDAPHYTPRISGMLMPDTAVPITLSILKANPADPTLTDRTTYRPAPPPPGLGYCLTTYAGDGNPLPSFSGDPLLLPCPGDAETILAIFWEALNDANRVALAVKSIDANGSRLIVRNAVN